MRLFGLEIKINIVVSPDITNKTFKTITANEVRTSVINMWGKPSEEVDCEDTYYKLIPRYLMEKFLKWDKTDEGKYKPQIFDCDDFTEKLVSKTVGWCEGACVAEATFDYTKDGKPMAHQIMVYLDENKFPWLIEPQSDIIYFKPKDWTLRGIEF